MLDSTCKIISNVMCFITLVVCFLLSIHVQKTSAAVINRFDIEFVRYDLPVTRIKKGTVLGSIYLKSQDFYFQTRTSRMDLAKGQLLLTSAGSGTTPDPGCTYPGFGVTGIGFLRYNVSGTRESVCNPNTEIVILDGLKFDYTGVSYKSPNSGILYNQKATVPRTKLVDIVVNDPLKVMSMQGQNLTFYLTSLGMKASYETRIITAGPSLPQQNPISFYLGKTNPVVFFPSQNSSSALLNLPVKPSGGNDSLAAGSASIDLCIYDGAGLSSSRYMLKFQDPNNSTNNDFRIYTLDGRGKMDYSVTLTDPSDIPQPVNNNTPFFWENMENGGSAQSRLRYLQVPNGIKGLVPCVPSIITAKVKPVRYSSLRSGSYSGKINIFFTPSTN